MMDDRERLRRLLIGGGIAILFLIIAYVALVFAAVVVFTIFLYYAVRPIFRSLDRFDLGRRVRAALSILLFGLPFVVLIVYTATIVASSVQEFLNSRGLLESGLGQLFRELNTGGIDLTSLQGLGGSQMGLEAVAGRLLEAASLAGSLFVQLLLIVSGTYYLLVDGPKLAEWFFQTYDDTGIVRRYARAVDDELSLTLFGNIVNIFITAVISLTTFSVYNLFAPTGAAVPFPALLAALAGVASLIPVIGIKIVYIPVCLALAANAWVIGQLELLVPIGILAVVSAVVVDFIPDIVVRAQVSSDQTHTGLLLVAYIVGPTVFGLYGLFLAPILLVCTTNAVTILLPYVLSGQRLDIQHTLDEYTDQEPSDAVPEDSTE
ncbi:AI-2E family transporter [Halovenus sp. WSH3]|uniref:AI-2E family transporter n=1 Tax=Halovenus carboxidivorans TaxID=2692199 RepID=A0A6B0TBK7_9EURY|nr:AI-2E family transporter [Halovenus carboxidivorans]MXR52290.1 AI-2E family transporter [Halovenus carboxidivorans]